MDLTTAYGLVRDLVKDLQALVYEKGDTSSFNQAWDKAVAMSATFYSKVTHYRQNYICSLGTFSPNPACPADQRRILRPTSEK